jgi:protein gp37
MNKTSIEWTEFTWNPIHARRKSDGKVGNFCTRISPGCTHCYAASINKRFGNGYDYTVPNLENVEFFLDEKELQAPFKLKKPSKIFVGDMFDLFHERIPGEFIAEVLRIAGLADQHTFQFLTKRASRMQRIVSLLRDAWGQLPDRLWFGVSVEDEERAQERIPFLQATPVEIKFLSIEPQLEKIIPDLREISWVIVGGESGHGARPMHPEWARSLRDQCASADVPFFFKQWGEWQPHQEPPDPQGSYHGGIFLLPSGQFGNQGDWWEGRAHAMDRVGKAKAGHVLDGREWLEFPTERLVTA